MIPTDYKNKLPKMLAYPVGAQILSGALADVPQLEELSLRFSRGDYTSTEKAGRYLCLEVEYINWHVGISSSRYLEEKGFYGPDWRIDVYAVPRSLNARIRRSLREHGLRMMRKWLSQPRSETWLDSQHHLSLWFCPESETLTPESDAD